MGRPAVSVANYILGIGETLGDHITHLKLQKLLFYSQAFYLGAYNGEKLFPEKVEAWEHGPVVRKVWDKYKGYGSHPLMSDPPGGQPVQFEHRQMVLINDVYETYGQYSAWRLRQMTHKELPWRIAWDQGERTGDYEITPEILVKHFEHRFEKKRA